MTDTVSALTDLDDVQVLDGWLRQCGALNREPDPDTVMALEAEANRRGFDCLTAAAALVGGPFAADLHPRGKDGKFIEKLGLIKLSDFTVNKGGTKISYEDRRGQVVEIVPDPAAPGNPDIKINLMRVTPGYDKQGNLHPAGSPSDEIITVKPDNVLQAPEKARLDAPVAPHLFGDPAGGPVYRTPVEADPFHLTGPQRPMRPGGNYYRGGAPTPAPAAPAKPAIGGPNATTLTDEQCAELAQQVLSGQLIKVDPPDIDDVILKFADNPGPVDLTLLAAFSSMRGDPDAPPRDQMPQISKELMDTFKATLRQDGHSFAGESVDPSVLKPTQRELDGQNVGGMIRSARDGSYNPAKDPIWISSDNKVLDGHHRWAAATALSTNCGGCVSMPVIRVDMPMKDLLAYANAFNDANGVERKAFGVTDVQPGGVPGVPSAPVASAYPGRMTAAGEPKKEYHVGDVPDPETCDMARDEDDGITVEYLMNAPELYHGEPDQPQPPA